MSEKEARVDLAFTRYVMRNMVWCMVYKRDVGGGGSYTAQSSCNSIAPGWAISMGGGVKGWFIRAQQPRRKRISCEGATHDRSGLDRQLAFTRYCFTLRLLCTNQPSFHFPRPPALPTLVQDYCTTIGQYTTPPSDLPCVCHTPYNIGNNNLV